MTIENCRVVLVRPHYAGNLGAVARVMRNFGLHQLVLVNPVADLGDREARRLSTHGEFILDQARTVSELGDAVADCGMVIATAGLVDGIVRERAAGAPEDLLRDLVPLLHDAPGALVFGPEPSGLTNAEIARCHGVIHIPADPGYAALNLAQSVAICLYELRKQWLKHQRVRASTSEPIASHGELERMFEHLRSGLEAVHFLYGPKAKTLMHGIRHLIGRAAPDQREIKILHGLARQLKWIAHRSPPAPREQASREA
jgi:tRNA/rRNA methyltransferase